MAYIRKKRRGYRLARKTRLILFVLAVCVLVAGVVLLARGLRGRDETASAPNVPAATQAADISDVSDASDAPDTSADDGDASDEALEQVANESVDLANDLAATPVREVSTGTENVAVIRSIGDIVAHTPLLKTAYNAGEKTYDFAPYFSLVTDVIANADYTVINVDGPLGGSKFAKYRGYPQFNTPPHLLTALKDAGVDMLTLSNNHALDTYFDGLIGTIENVEKAGLDHIGTYATQADHDAPYILSINNIRVGFLNYTVGTNNMLKRSDAAAQTYGIRTTGNSNAPLDIRTLRDAGAEAIVVYMHWGEEYERTPSASIRKMAQKLANAGADVVVGGHPHVVLPCEWVASADAATSGHRALVLYSMGNFLSDQRARYRDSGIVFEFTLEKDAQGNVSVLTPHYIPIYVHRYKTDTGYDYRVLPCAAMIESPPDTLPNDVLQRIKQVWNEQKAIMQGGPATVLPN